MKALSKFLCGLSSRIPLLLLAFSGMVLMAGCTGINPLSLLQGQGTNAAANVQAGKTNTQTVGQTNNIAPQTVVKPDANVDTVDQSTNTTTNNELPLWVWIALIVTWVVGWATDTPATMIRQLLNKK